MEVSVLLYGCTTWTLLRHLEKKLDRNYRRIQYAVLNKFWKQHLTKQHHLYGHLTSISQIIQIRSTSHAGYCWRNRNELKSEILLWIPTNEHTSVGQPAKTYIHQLCADAGVRMPGAKGDRDRWQKRVKGICASSMTWWWYQTNPHLRQNVS